LLEAREVLWLLAGKGAAEGNAKGVEPTVGSV